MYGVLLVTSLVNMNYSFKGIICFGNCPSTFLFPVMYFTSLKKKKKLPQQFTSCIGFK